MKPFDLVALKLTDRETERFWSKVDLAAGRGGGCWPWKGCTDQDGYGFFQVYRHPRRNMIRAHRLAYFLVFGKDLGELQGCHRCDNPGCCNPKHLFPGSNLDNAADMAAKGRAAKLNGTRNGGAKLTSEQVAEILALYATGQHSQVALGRRFGVTGGMVHMIVRGKSWRHVQGGQVEVRA